MADIKDTAIVTATGAMPKSLKITIIKDIYCSLMLLSIVAVIEILAVL